MFARVKSIGLSGLNAFVVDSEATLEKGIPSFSIVGLPDTSIKESKDRIRAAICASSIKFPTGMLMVNLAPASTKKSGSLYDVAILISIVKAMGIITDDLDDYAFIGEVSLNGNVRAVDGVLPMVIKARKMGLHAIFVPIENAYEASVVEGITIFGVETVRQLIDHLCGDDYIFPQSKYVPQDAVYDDTVDFSDVKGQYCAKRALEIAAAGNHNVIMIGAPGSGKSMLARRMPTILPPLTFEESLETTNVHSISGLVDRNTPIVVSRPFRAPHHTISPASLVGGGSIPHPGEISLAHNGVLFLDEFAEFNKKAIDALRQPLEDGFVTISRVSGTVSYPCSVMLICATNPCPCGYFGHPTRECICPPEKAKSYISRITGPVLDRIDIHAELAPVEFNDLTTTKKGESSAQIRKRVIAARKIQEERYRGTDIKYNAYIPPSKIQEICTVTDKGMKLFKKIFDKYEFNVRTYDKVLKIARTIADLENSEVITETHISEASQYRTLDRKYWRR